MRSGDWANVPADAVVEFWFPDDGHAVSYESHREFWRWRMRGGADEAIRTGFTELAHAAARGFLDHWAEVPRGRLALIVTLDQFSRSVWRETPGAYAQDIKAARMAWEGLCNGQYSALQNPWEKAFWLIAIGHCEGPDHLDRMDHIQALFVALVTDAPEHLRLNYRLAEDQNRLSREVIATFGRYPHRNAVLGRISTPAEEAYISAGEFPHQRKIPAAREDVERLLAHHKSAVGSGHNAAKYE